jgi:predicted O-methyltransferase YrrM
MFRALGVRDSQTQRAVSWRHGRLPRVELAEAFPGIESVDVTLLRTFDRTVDTSVDVNELAAICAIERFLQASSVLEIGTFDGNTTLNLAANVAESGRVVTLDLPPSWTGDYEYGVPDGYDNVTASSEVGRQYRESPLSERVEQIYGDSATLDWSTLNPPFDLIFIDGNHYFDYVQRDTKNALASVAPGGAVIWHDYGLFEDVSRVVDAEAESLSIQALSGTRLAVATFV